jgi:LytS/YehU family sensor histidine kinase
LAQYKDKYLVVGAYDGVYLLDLEAFYQSGKRQRQRQIKAQEEYDAYIQAQELLEQSRLRQIGALKLETLLSQLNPHFIFNILQSVQNRIVRGDPALASSLILDLSRLMRRFLESTVHINHEKTRHVNITLEDEINLLKSYIQFEQMLFNHRFDYEIQLGENLDAPNIQIPPMMIQPYVENAIKHGITYEKEKRCLLAIGFERNENDELICTITDNGVGRKRAKEIQATFIKLHQSRGTEISDKRIRIMQDMGIGISVETKDNPAGGTIVELKIDI